MTTIDKLSLSVYNEYALRIEWLHAFNEQIHMEAASTIAPQLQVVDVYPKPTELEILLGIIPKATSWGYFAPPPKFRDTRRSPFAFSRVAPIFGLLPDAEEKEEEKLDIISCEDPEEENERQVLRGCLRHMHKINQMMGYIIGRVGQFLQG